MVPQVNLTLKMAAVRSTMVVRVIMWSVTLKHVQRHFNSYGAVECTTSHFCNQDFFFKMVTWLLICIKDHHAKVPSRNMILLWVEQFSIEEETTKR